jgi:arylsulfatase A-like enzyme
VRRRGHRRARPRRAQRFRLRPPWFLLAAGLIPAACEPTGDVPPEAGSVVRPNILLVVADDLGYADLGAFGSEIRTPNLDALAAEGVVFTQFHTAPMCAPTRAMLLSGNNNHVAGMGAQSIRLPVPGYENALSDRIVPFPRLLQEAGYRTYTAGKWHLGNDEENSPTAAGFTRSFNLLHGAGSHFSDTGFFEGGSLYREDGVLTEWPPGAYSTELFTDRLLEFLEEGRESGDPFFVFAAYTSPHWPLQVPEEELDRYAGRYDQGYDRLREENLERLKGAGIVAPDHPLPPANPAVTPWEELSPRERRYEARKMELYAAMVENLDSHVGRLVSWLKDAGEYENTLIVFMSDNGAAGEDFYNDESFRDYVRTHYSAAYEDMGRPGSWISYGVPWAEAGSAPYRRHKTHTLEGGIVAPMIVSGAGVERQGEISHAYVTVMDLAPTFLEVSGARYPVDRGVRPLLGESMAGLLSGGADEVHGPDYVTTLSHGGRSFLRQGRWKLVDPEAPTREEDFELYDLSVDPGEVHDLRDAEPERFAAMLELWRSQKEALELILMSEARGAAGGDP